MEFANKANDIGPWIGNKEEKLRSIALKVQGSLEVCEINCLYSACFLGFCGITRLLQCAQIQLVKSLCYLNIIQTEDKENYVFI